MFCCIYLADASLLTFLLLYLHPSYASKYFFVKSLLLPLIRLSFHYLAFTTFVAILSCLLYFRPNRVPSRYSI